MSNDNAARYAAARAAVALAALAHLEGDAAALRDAIVAAAEDGLLAEALAAAVEAYAGTLAALISPEKARQTVERALESAELDLAVTSPSATGR